MIASFVAFVWWVADHAGRAQSIASWIPTVKPYSRTMWSYVVSVDSIWYQGCLFGAGIAWVVYVASRPEHPGPGTSNDPQVNDQPEPPRQFADADRQELEKQLQTATLDLVDARREIVRLTPPKRTEFLFCDYVWELTDHFFKVYPNVLTPNWQTLDQAIDGPFCSNCSRNLKHDVSTWETGPGVYQIENPCPCGHRGPQELAGDEFQQFHDAVYREAQRVARRNEPFPTRLSP